MMASHQPRVFISYQRADETLARQVRDHLVSHGVQTRLDQYDIPVGTYWLDEIDQGLAGSDIVVGILDYLRTSAHNIDSTPRAMEDGLRDLTSGCNGRCPARTSAIAEQD